MKRENVSIEENYEKGGVEKRLSFKNATGKMPYTLKNDYLFRATLQESQKALKGLLGAILGIEPEEIVSAEIKNPIELGVKIDNKDFILDIRVLLNNRMLLNLEMQVVNLGNWPERSLSYLCRSFDQLNRGEDYKEILPVIQVCFLDFTLFEDYPEFFATYMFQNIKKYTIYSDKMKLFVIDLNQIHRATAEDRRRKIDYWARLFKATTWEEVKMITENNTYLEEAAETAYRMTAEDRIREQCEAREDFLRQQSYIQKRLAEAEEAREDFLRQQSYIQKRLAEAEEALRQQSYIQKQLAEAEEALRQQSCIQKQLETAVSERDALAAENAFLKERLAGLEKGK